MVEKDEVSRRAALAVSGLAVGGVLLGASAAQAQSKKAERRHPRLTKAIEELTSAKEYLEQAPNDFGGFKRKAILSIETAIIDLKKALEHGG